MTEPDPRPTSLEHKAAAYLNATMFLVLGLLLFGVLAWKAVEDLPGLIREVTSGDNRLMAVLMLLGRAVLLVWPALFVRWAFQKLRSI